MSWQPFHSMGHEGLPVSLPGLVLRAPRLLVPLALCWACGCGVPRLSAHHAEVVLSAALMFLWFQFAIWSQDSFIDLGGRWVGAVRTPWVHIHQWFVIPLACQFLFLLSLPVQVVISLGDQY